MNRRQLLTGILAAGTAVAVGEIWTPSRTIFLPPMGGWPTYADALSYLETEHQRWMREFLKRHAPLPGSVGHLKMLIETVVTEPYLFEADPPFRAIVHVAGHHVVAVRELMEANRVIGTEIDVHVFEDPWA